MDKVLSWLPGWSALLLLPALFVAFTAHELAHAIVAYLLGDTSQVERRRLSFNPLRHISWLGMIAFLLLGFGWARPVLVDWTRFRLKNRAFGMLLVSVAGASANLLVAFITVVGMMGTAGAAWLLKGVDPVGALFLLLTHTPGPDALGLAVALSTNMLYVNIVLALFNLLPLPPLDGFQAVMSLVTMIRAALKRSPTRPTGEEAGEEGASRSPAHIHFDIALAYHKAGELDEAIARYRQAIAQDSQFGLAYYNLGLAYLAKGRQTLAGSAFRAVGRTRSDIGLQVEANRRLRELAQADQEPATEGSVVPQPLERDGQGQGLADRTAPLDPALARRLWLRLGLGGALALVLAGAAWLFITVVTLGAMG